MSLPISAIIVVTIRKCIIRPVMHRMIIESEDARR